MAHDNADHTADPPSEWVVRFAPEIPPGTQVLDLACGTGRHTRLFLGLGHPVLAVDKDTRWLADIADIPGLTIVEGDLETADGPPAEIAALKFAGVVVTNYLHRPLLPWIMGAVAVGGVLIYETFAVGNEKYGHPRNPNFLLKPAELQDAFGEELDVLAYDAGQVDRGGTQAVIQRIAAKRF
ncbi:MAG: SAM-dependent methyltransferase [Alphaproteobacteria bacterium]|nr:SAM-dependent methyltransferase [Alphaproteobacteria bacterium]MBT5859907.1 SAM-dependent methyltransferase [Alphaproteobacteria bacterium]